MSDQGRPGLALAGLGLLLALVSLAVLSWVVGFVAAFGLALVCLLGLAGAGTWIELDRARSVHPAEAIEGVRAVLRLLVAFALITPFWSLFDQKASTWVLQADHMVKPDWFAPSQMQALNPALVMILIPFNNLVLYPILRRWGYEPTALRRMTTGIAFAGMAWVVVGFMQLRIDSAEPLSIVVAGPALHPAHDGRGLVSATGLEFAYSQAPPSMKGVIMSFWYLGVTVGNVWVLLANKTVRSDAVIARIQETGLGVTAFLMFFFAVFAFLAAIAFGLYARRYRMVDNYRG